MLELIILLVASLFLVTLFLFWSFDQRETNLDLSSANVGKLLEFVPLSGISYQRVDRVFDAGDYQFLASQTRLRGVARQLERDRRQAALLWLKHLREDFKTLQRLHRVLIACGARTDLQTECRLLIDSISFRLLHPLLTMWIRVFGLYAWPRAHERLLISVRQASTLLANIVWHLSPTQLAYIKQLWNAHELKVSLGKL